MAARSRRGARAGHLARPTASRIEPRRNGQSSASTRGQLVEGTQTSGNRPTGSFTGGGVDAESDDVAHRFGDVNGPRRRWLRAKLVTVPSLRARAT